MKYFFLFFTLSGAFIGYSQNIEPTNHHDNWRQFYDSIGKFTEVEFPVNEDSLCISSSVFENNYLKNGESFKIIEEYENFRMTYVDRSAIYIDLEAFENAYILQQSFAVVKKEGKYGLVNQKGKLVLPMNYDKIINFRGDFNPVIITIKNKETQILNCSFNPIIDSTVQLLHLCQYSSHTVLLVSHHEKQQISIVNTLGDIVYLNTPLEHPITTETNTYGDFEYLIIQKDQEWWAKNIYYLHNNWIKANSIEELSDEIWNNMD